MLKDLPETPSDILSFLCNEGFEDPEFETKLIMTEILSIPYSKDKLYENRVFSISEKEKISKFWASIKAKKPIQYTIGYTYVNGVKILISDKTLCPGPEIEDLILAAQKILSSLSQQLPINVIDLCTGCGVVGVVLGKQYPDTKFYSTDISGAALEIARENQQLHAVSNMTLLQGDLFKAVKGLGLEGTASLLVANPPYCKTKDILSLPSQVKNYAPRIAINGGDDGLFFHREIIHQADKYLLKGGYILLENEVGQSNFLQDLLKPKFDIIEVIKNTRGEERVLLAQINK